MRLAIGAGEDSPLARRLAWLTAVRLVVLTLFLGITERYYFKKLGFGGFSSQVALVSIGLAYGLAAAYAVLLRRGRALGFMAHAQLVTDQMIWTAIAYISGGVTSGATSLYGLTCLSGAIMLYRWGALSAAIAGVASYLAMCAAFATHLLPPPLDQVQEAYITSAQDMVYPAMGSVMATSVVALLATHLADRLWATGGELRAATERAEQAERLAAMGRLAAALAHEIRNPLSAIRGSIELLRTGGSLPPEEGRLCEIVEREVGRINDLVGDMMHLARPRAPDRADMDLAATAQSVVELARKAPRGTEVPVRYEGPSLLRVNADAAQMRQLLWNLVRNAMQSSPPAEEVVVRISQLKKEGVRLEVEDNGPGIKPEDRERIFDAFYTTRAHGIGVGLAVVKQVAEAHHFAIEVENKKSKGTTFALRIPAASVVLLALWTLAAASGCGSAHGWQEAATAPEETVGTQEEAWTSAPSPNEPSPVGPRDVPAAQPEATSSQGSPGSGPGAGAADSVPIHLQGRAGSGSKPPPSPSTDAFRNTYYDFPHEVAAAPGEPTEKLFGADCKLIQTVSRTFHDQVCVQGSGRLASGQTVSFAKRNCFCAALCPRTKQHICFEALDPARFPYGRGAQGTPIIPLRSVAVDPSVVPLGTVLFIPEFEGLRDLKGQPHDGCFVADDRGLSVQGRHVDIYTGSAEQTRAWNAAVPSNGGVHVVLDAPRCAHLH